MKVEGLSKTYRSRKDSVQVLNNLSLEVTEGEMLVLLGPSGCGKTTLLRCIVGLEQADAGRIELAGKEIVNAERGIFTPAEKRGVGMVFQNYSLWPHMTVQQNVEFPLRARGLKDVLRGGRATEALEIVQCAHLADRYPPQLSGGQQQRVALARALSSRPDVMLLDEPLSNLDALLRIDLRAQLHQMHRSLGFTGIYVTHDQVEAMSLGTRVVVMRAGQIEQIGAPAFIYSRPSNEYVAEFLGMRNRIEVLVAEGGQRLQLGRSTIDVQGGGMAAGVYALRARASEIDLRVAGSGKPGLNGTVWIPGGKVVDCLPCGETTDFIVDFEGQTLFVEMRGKNLPAKSDLVDIGMESAGMLLYGKEGRLAQPA